MNYRLKCWDNLVITPADSW